MSANENLEHLRSLFEQSLEQPESERDAWLQRQCAQSPETLARLRRLIAQQHKPVGALADDAIGLLGRLLPADESADNNIGNEIGPYRLTRMLGEGGMGRVYLAERVDGQFNQQVALKLIRGEFATAELHQRFLRERDTLARLAHPNIAQLHDGGVSAAGAPYFTLEFIEGEPITHLCDAQALDVRSRLRLLMKVCDAVQYAHRNLIVHRDLKPSNILVTAAGEPKLLDFGIAKPLTPDAAAAGLTNTQATPMTREYAAPEQLLGDPITTATDVYALGVLLYLLLCGQMPYRRAALGQISWTKAILEEPPEALDRAIDRETPHREGTSDAGTIAAARSASPQTLKRSLRGDLERIVQRALAKAPEARYATVSAMAEDLRAFLDGRPISGGTRTYKLRKFVRRHWLPLSAGALLFLVVLAAAIGLAWESAQVERQARTARAVKDFALDIFKKANPNVARGKLLTLRDAVDEGVLRADKIPDEQRQVKAEILNTLGTVYYQLGVHKQAYALHRRAFDLVQARPEDAVLASEAERFAAVEAGTMGDLTQAQQFADDAVQRLHAAGAPRLLLARALSTAGWVAAKREDQARLQQTSDEGLRLSQQSPPDDEVTYLAMEQKATLTRKQHDLPRAIEFYKKALELTTRVEGVGEQQGITYRQQIGASYGLMGRYAEGKPYLQEAFDLAKRAFGESGTRALRIGEILGVDEFESGDVLGAEAHFAQLIALGESHVPLDENVLAELRLNHAETLVSLGRYEQAETLLVRVRDYLAAHEGSDPAERSETISTLGELHRLTGRLELGEREQREALAILAAAKMDYSAPVNARLGRVLLDRGQRDAALQAGQEAAANATKIAGERAHDTALAHYVYGLALAAAGRTDEAEQALRAALHSYVLLLPPDGLHVSSAEVRLALADLLARYPEQHAEATRLIEQAVQLRSTVFGPDDARTREARTHGIAAAN
jgi:serine/threonine protein kinase/tetratricopeptide (TPR) repeat protein